MLSIAARDGRPATNIYPIGIRARRLPPDVAPHGVGAIVLAGFGGALDPALRIGDVVVETPNDVLFLLRPDEKLPYIAGGVYDSDHLVATIAEKQHLFQMTGAAVVDMESAMVRALAAKSQVPLILVRAITDAAEDAIDPATLRLVDSYGRPRGFRIAAGLLRRPYLAPHLMRLGNRARVAEQRLGEVVAWISQQPTEQWWRPRPVRPAMAPLQRSLPAAPTPREAIRSQAEAAKKDGTAPAAGAQIPEPMETVLMETTPWEMPMPGASVAATQTVAPQTNGDGDGAMAPTSADARHLDGSRHSTAGAYSAMLFDMDGLMADTERLSWQTLRELARRLGTTVSDDTLRRMMGRSPLEGIMIFMQDLDLNESPFELLKMRDAALLSRLRMDVRPMPGLHELLVRVSGRFRLAVVTSSPMQFADIVLDKLGVREQFELVQTADGLQRGKPDPEIYLQAARKIGVPPANCIALEDSATGVMSAAAAGTYVIAVPNDHTRGQDFSAADFVAGDLLDAGAHLSLLEVPGGN